MILLTAAHLWLQRRTGTHINPQTFIHTSFPDPVGAEAPTSLDRLLVSPISLTCGCRCAGLWRAVLPLPSPLPPLLLLPAASVIMWILLHMVVWPSFIKDCLIYIYTIYEIKSISESFHHVWTD